MALFGPAYCRALSLRRDGVHATIAYPGLLHMLVLEVLDRHYNEPSHGTGAAPRTAATTSLCAVPSFRLAWWRSLRIARGLTPMQRGVSWEDNTPCGRGRALPTSCSRRITPTSTHTLSLLYVVGNLLRRTFCLCYIFYAWKSGSGAQKDNTPHRVGGSHLLTRRPSHAYS